MTVQLYRLSRLSLLLGAILSRSGSMNGSPRRDTARRLHEAISFAPVLAQLGHKSGQGSHDGGRAWAVTRRVHRNGPLARLRIHSLWAN
jgi:hypothetical protein